MYEVVSNFTPEGIRFLFGGEDELTIPYVAAYQDEMNSFWHILR